MRVAAFFRFQKLKSFATGRLVASPLQPTKIPMTGRGRSPGLRCYGSFSSSAKDCNSERKPQTLPLDEDALFFQPWMKTTKTGSEFRSLIRLISAIVCPSSLLSCSFPSPSFGNSLGLSNISPTSSNSTKASEYLGLSLGHSVFVTLVFVGLRSGAHSYRTSAVSRYARLATQ